MRLNILNKYICDIVPTVANTSYFSNFPLIYGYKLESTVEKIRIHKTDPSFRQYPKKINVRLVYMNTAN